MYAEALAELEQIAPEDRASPEVLLAKAVILQSLAEWPAMVEIASDLVRLRPDLPDGWILWAYAARRAQSLAVADLILRQAEKIHPVNATIHFNLACYACQLGNLLVAQARLSRALSLDGSFRKAAETDPDLEPLREAGVLLPPDPNQEQTG